MLKKISKFILILMIFMILFNYDVFAVSASDLKPSYTAHSSSFVRIGRELLGWIRNIAAIVLVILLAFFGLKFMMGSVDQKAEYKKSLMPLIIGTFVVLGATTITNIVWNIGEQSVCQHDFGGKKCGDANMVCLKCGVPGPSEHTFEHKSSGMGGSWSEWDECKYCHVKINMENYNNGG